MFYQEFWFYHGINHKVDEEDKTFYLDHRVSKSLGSYQVNIYMETPILIPPNWQVEFHVHIDASLLVVVAMLAQNSIGKYDHPIVYASRLLNKIEQNYTTIDRVALTMVYVLHKFKLFCWETYLFFYVNHVAFVYLDHKPQVFGRITKWLLLFLEYKFTIVYNLGRTHVVTNVLSILSDNSKPLGVLDQIIDASLFSIEPMWMQEVKNYLKTS
jgi:hypothetical protein